MPKATAPLEKSTPRKFQIPDQMTATLGASELRVDDGRHGVRRVVEAVDELEAERDQKRQAEKQEGKEGLGRRAGNGNVAVERVGGEDETDHEQPAEGRQAGHIHSLIEIGPLRDRFAGCQLHHFRLPSGDCLRLVASRLSRMPMTLS